MLQQLRESFAEGAFQRFLGRCQDSDDTHLRERLIAVVEAINAQALDDGEAETWTRGDIQVVTTWLSINPESTVEHSVAGDGHQSHHIRAERRVRVNAGPWLFTTNAADADFAVRFMPGGGFDTAEGFLEHVATEAGVTVPEGS